jgi:protein-histidine pros-kinase
VSDPAKEPSFDDAALLRTLFENGPDAVICTDTSGYIIRANPRAEALFGYEPGGLIGLAVEALVPERLRARHAADRGERDGHRRPMGAIASMHGRRKDGSEFPVAISLSSVDSGQGRFVTAVIADMTPIHEAQQQLRDSEERYRELVELSPDAYIVLVEDSAAFVNSSGLRLLGARSADQVAERRFADFFRPESRERLAALLDSRGAAPGERVAFDDTLVRLDGTPVYVEVLVLPARYRGQSAVQVVIRDLSERKRLEELHIRALAAEESDRMKTLLLSTVSHELRTPLTAVRGYASTILDYYDRLESDEVFTYLRGIDDAALHLERMVSDLLTLSRLENGVLAMDLTDFSLAPFLKKTVAGRAAASPTLALLFENDAGRPTRVRADRTRISQVLTNLIDNAVAHGDASRPIEVRLARAGNEALVSVRDHGPGVSSDRLEAIFEPFTRGAAPGNTRGAGLGLAICRGIIHAHGGRIWAEKAGDGGLRVSFTVPIRTAAGGRSVPEIGG